MSLPALSTEPVPFLDLASHHRPHREEFRNAIEEVIDTGAFAGGRFVQQFEESFARYCETAFAAGVGNGTDALWFALLACGIGPGDEVITVPMTFVATVEAIVLCGATPVFVDVDETTFTLDPTQLEGALTPRTKAILPVHLFGQAADMDPIMAFAKKHGLVVIEDAAQAHGARYKGRRVGSIGDAGCFSCYPGKNLGGFGEAGAVTTSSPEIQKKIEVFRDHGQPKKYHHSGFGWNGRLDGIQAAVLEIKLRHLDDNNGRRDGRAADYDTLLADVPRLLTPARTDGFGHVYHIYAIRSPERDALGAALSAAGIGWGIHYPIPVHLQDGYVKLGYGAGDFPVSEKCSAEFLSLPMFPELTDDQVARVATEVRRFAVG